MQGGISRSFLTEPAPDILIGFGVVLALPLPLPFTGAFWQLFAGFGPEPH
ncbi:hypothetical protein GHA01_29580 [Novacetimonas hansenii]|uniref:Uncharacterized protein n=2 Tax=Novacetimonas hansenii TaxID=436 RepID=A0ABQ0SIK7_NOVHA|nr:hypothetical protein GXY_14572 [Novacetimonas hansenii ATCC 23769]GAN85353.1 hypothetical protein Gaha_0390_001 [Novacetimonas hansenii JCM 7643]GEC65109.1 hypothetical protein GHA01_29580 [Novacetimonas hansenii]